MLLVRFFLTVLFMVAVVAAAVLANAGWLIAVALLALVVATISVARILQRYTGAPDWLGPNQEAQLMTDRLVEHETGSPVRHRWHGRRAQKDADAVTRRGVVVVPDGWRGPDGTFRVLLVTTGPISAEQFQDALSASAAGEDLAVLVLVPTLAPNAMAVAVGDPWEAVAHAEDVAQRTVAALQAAGVHASGHIGPADPAVAIADGLRTYAAQQVIVARHRKKPLRHHEDVPVQDAARAFDTPLLEIPLEHGVVVH